MPRQSASRKRATGFWQPELVGIIVLIAAMYLMPYVLVDDFLISKYSRYLVFGLLAMALSLSWGYGGILNLGQALPFGLGSYCMAMALKLRTIPVQTGAGGLPDFMVWNNVQQLPWFWAPFYSMTFAIIAGIVVPSALMAALGWFMFRGRVTGVFVAIIDAGSTCRRQPADHRPAAIYRRLQRHHRSGAVDDRRHRVRRLQLAPRSI